MFTVWHEKSVVDHALSVEQQHKHFLRSKRGVWWMFYVLVGLIGVAK